jgi:hypothetical protein
MAKTNDPKIMNAAANGSADLNGAISDFEKQILTTLTGWEKVETGFPPYWKPEIGKCILARVTFLDCRDPSFHRLVCQATKFSIPCHRGPVDGAEDIVVNPGEFFTMSPYAALNLMKFVDLEVFIKCAGERKIPADKERGLPTRDMFEWIVMVSPEDKKILQQRNQEEMTLLAARRTAGEGEIMKAG